MTGTGTGSAVGPQEAAVADPMRPLSPDDPRAVLLAAPLSRYQIGVLTLVGFLAMLDGFDLFIMTFAAPVIEREWRIGKEAIGYILSAGLLGMAAGSLLLSPLADLIGRRRLLLLALAFMVVGTLGTALSGTLGLLIATRVVTGLGMGGVIALLAPLAIEYANARRRNMAVVLSGMGFPAGGMIGGAISAYLLAQHGWRSVFFLASALGVLAAVAVWRWLLDPIALVIARPRADALDRTNAYLRRCGQAEITALPSVTRTPRAPVRELLAPGMRGQTIKITLIYFLYVIPVYYMHTWLPTLAVDSGLSPSAASLVASLYNAGALLGGVVIALLGHRWNLKAALMAFALGGVATIALIGSLPASFAPFAAASLVAGTLIQGGIMLLYIIVARTFPAEMRATGAGIVIGVGRIGSILPPTLAGLLLAAGMSRSDLSFALAAPALVAIAILASFRIARTEIA